LAILYVASLSMAYFLAMTKESERDEGSGISLNWKCACHTRIEHFVYKTTDCYYCNMLQCKMSIRVVARLAWYALHYTVAEQ